MLYVVWVDAPESMIHRLLLLVVESRVHIENSPGLDVCCCLDGHASSRCPPMPQWLQSVVVLLVLLDLLALQ